MHFGLLGVWMYVSPLASPRALHLRTFRQRLPAAEDMVTFRQLASI